MFYSKRRWGRAWDEERGLLQERDSRGSVTEVPGGPGWAHATLALATAATGRRQRWGAQDFNKVTEAVEWSHTVFSANRATATGGPCVQRSRPGLAPHRLQSHWTTALRLSQRLNRPPCERAYRWKSL